MLSDEQNKNLSAVAKGRRRDSKGRLLPATIPLEARITELEAQLIEKTIACEYNAAEVIRLAESLRLAEQGRDKWCVECSKWRIACEAEMETRGQRERLLSQISLALGNRDEWDNALPLAKAHAASERNNGELRKEIYGMKMRVENLSEDKQALTTEVGEQKAAKRLAEGRYIALQRQRTTEFAITAVVMLVGTLLFAGIVVVMGGAK